jgi:hypothetical protein
MACAELVNAARASALLAFALASAPCIAEKFVAFGTQPDGAQLYVQAAPPLTLASGKRQGWFRTVPKTPQSVTDELGVTQQYTEMLALNVADCASRVMGSASMTYRDNTGTIVAKFDLPPAQVEFVKVRANTLGDAMFAWLCAAKAGAPAPLPSGSASPFK